MHLKNFLRQLLLTGSGHVGHVGPTKRRQALQVVCWQTPRSSWASNAFLQNIYTWRVQRERSSWRCSHTSNLLGCGAVSVLVVFAKLGAALVSAVVVCGLCSGRGCGGGGHGDRTKVYRPIHKVMKFMSLYAWSCKTARKVLATRGQLTFVTDSRSLIVNRPGTSERNLYNAVVSIRAVTIATEGASTRLSWALCADVAAIALVFYKSIVALLAALRSAVAQVACAARKHCCRPQHYNVNSDG